MEIKSWIAKNNVPFTDDDTDRYFYESEEDFENFNKERNWVSANSEVKGNVQENRYITVNPNEFDFDIRNSNYVKLNDRGKDYYYYISNYVIHSDTSITLSLYLDYWNTYFFEYFNQLDGNVKVLRNHQDRYKITNSGVLFDINVNSDVWNIDTEYTDLNQIEYNRKQDYPHLFSFRSLRDMLNNMKGMKLYRGSELLLSVSDDLVLQSKYYEKIEIKNYWAGNHGSGYPYYNIDTFIINNQPFNETATVITYDTENATGNKVWETRRPLFNEEPVLKGHLYSFQDRVIYNVLENNVNVYGVNKPFDNNEVIYCNDINKSMDSVAGLSPIVKMFIPNETQKPSKNWSLEWNQEKKCKYITIGNLFFDEKRPYYPILNVRVADDGITLRLHINEIEDLYMATDYKNLSNCYDWKHELTFYNVANLYDIEATEFLYGVGHEDLNNPYQPFRSYEGALSPVFSNLWDVNIDYTKAEAESEPQCYLYNSGKRFSLYGNVIDTPYYYFWEIRKKINFSLNNLYFSTECNLDTRFNFFEIVGKPNQMRVIDLTTFSITDTQAEWLKQNKNGFATQMAVAKQNQEYTKQEIANSKKQMKNSKLNADFGVAKGVIGGLAGGAAGGAMVGGPIGAVVGGIVGGLGGGLSGANKRAQSQIANEGQAISNRKADFNAQAQIDSLNAQQADLANANNSITMCDDFEWGIKECSHLFYECDLKPVQTQQDEWFQKVFKDGYISGNQKPISKDLLITRSRFNFWQIGKMSDAIKDLQLNIKTKNYFDNVFNEGVRLWRFTARDSFKDYFKDNNLELSLL